MIPANKFFLTPEQEEYFRENYPTTLDIVLAEKFGISKNTVRRLARELGLPKDLAAIEPQRRQRISESLRRSIRINGFKGHSGNGEKTWFKAGFKPREMFGEEKFKEMHRKAVETRKKRFAEERARVNFGLLPRTKMRVIKQPQQKIQDRSYLKKRGYIIDDTNNIAYYTEATRRATRMEAKPKRFYTFKPYENKEQQ